ncbi:hypothetical protein F4859DRAFT_486405 [Xylaria cf. heliscus]|nr:hypothetical protein F4859DRAFT_486405 [Xylaria cf. heliscus]
MSYYRISRLRLVPRLGSPKTCKQYPRYASTSASEASELLKATYNGRVITRRQYLDGNQLQKLSLTLNRRHLHPNVDISQDAPPVGTILPPGYHLAYFTPNGLESELGADGTDRSFNVSAPFTRRMWAGGSMRWTKDCPLRVGDEAEERTRLISAEPKTSRDGNEMVLVRVEKEFWNDKGLAVVDERSWIFRAGGVKFSNTSEDILLPVLKGPSSVEDVRRPDTVIERHFSWSPVALFRFSALTFNGHKIHYDAPWSKSEERQAGIVVHGPLNLINMLDYWRDVIGDGSNTVGEVVYRATSPIYAGERYAIRASPGDQQRKWEVLVQKDGVLCMKGQISVA